MKCKECGADLELTARMPDEQVVKMRLEYIGEVLPAREVGETILNFRKLFNSCAKDMGAKTDLYIRRIEQGEKFIEIEFLLMRVSSAKSA